VHTGFKSERIKETGASSVLLCLFLKCFHHQQDSCKKLYNTLNAG